MPDVLPGADAAQLAPALSRPGRPRRAWLPWRRRVVPAVAAELVHAMALRVLDAGIGGVASVGIASVLHREGASTIACGLADCLATQLGQRVALVDANLRSPVLRRVFGIMSGPGLAEVLAGAVPIEAALRSTGEGRLTVLPASVSSPANPAALAAGAMDDLIAELHGLADIVLFDMAPLRSYPDAALLARHLDGMIVVLRAERSRWDVSEQAVQELRDTGVPLLGAVLNRQRRYIPRVIDRLL